MMKSILTLHGTSVEVKERGILISGTPGSGKSSLALQLIDRGAILIADDQTILSLEGQELVLHCPLRLKGIMEIRNVGLCSFPVKPKSFLKLCIQICENETIERLPEPMFIKYHGVKVPLLKLNKGDPVGALKVEMKLNHKEESHV
jgi:HPr kinase/phosphorylase